MKRPSWKRLTLDQQLWVANLAKANGLTHAAEKANVSKVAVRNACAIHGILPKPYHRAISKQARIATARSLLRSLRLKPEDLLT